MMTMNMMVDFLLSFLHCLFLLFCFYFIAVHFVLVLCAKVSSNQPNNMHGDAAPTAAMLASSCGAANGMIFPDEIFPVWRSKIVEKTSKNFIKDNGSHLFHRKSSDNLFDINYQFPFCRIA